MTTRASDNGTVRDDAPAASDPALVTRPLFSAPVVVAGTVTANQGTPTLDAASWPVHQVGALPAGGNTIGVVGIDPVANDVTTEMTSGATLNNGVETVVAGVAVQILAANAARKSAIIQNTGPTNIRWGAAGVTAVTGHRLAPGETATLNMPWCPTDAIFAIRETAVSSVAFASEIT